MSGRPVLSRAMIIALVVLAAVAVLAVGVVAADRAGATLAEGKASAALSAPFGQPATVRVHGSPFLTQALRGRYRDVEVRGTLRIGEIAGAALDARLRNVRLPLRDLLARRVRELPCEHVRGQVVLPYTALARAARLPGLALRFEDGRLLATAALPVPDATGLAAMLPGLGSVVPGLGSMLPGLGSMVPGFGQLTRVDGEAMLTLRGPNEVWLALKDVSLAGLPVPAVVVGQLLPSSAVPIPLPSLPYGLRLDAVRPTARGLVVDGSTAAVVLRTGDPVERAEGRPTRQDVRPTD